ncbi:Bax inhibitor-1/YccA family protein [soil metagenome]
MNFNNVKQINPAGGYRAGSDVTDIANPDAQRVLRNTYWLLALSLVPTIAGAWIGITFNLGAMFRGLGGTLVYFAVAFGFIFAIQKFRNSSAGVGLLLGFTFFMGVTLSNILTFYLAAQNGPQIVGLAAGGTAAVFFGMATLASTIKRDISGWGKFLFIGVIMLVVASIANIFLQMPALQITLAVLALGIFSALLLFNLNQVVRGGETNYVSATLSVYLSLINIFVSLLQIFGLARGDD